MFLAKFVWDWQGIGGSISMGIAPDGIVIPMGNFSVTQTFLRRVDTLHDICMNDNWIFF